MTHECSARAEWKNYEILLFVMLTSILTWKSNAHPGGLTFGSISSLCGEKLQSNARVCLGDGPFWNWMVSFLYCRDWKRKCFDFSLIGIMLSMLKLLGNLTAQLWWNDLPWISLFTQNNECHVDDENLLSKKFVHQLLNWAFIWWTFWFLCPVRDKNWDAFSTAQDIYILTPLSWKKCFHVAWHSPNRK